jgi:nicotinate-nucleotide adenylyltransferase
MRRIGLFGGTFDPPHLGHLCIALWALVELRLSEVVFMPAGQPPHKLGRPLSRASHRLAMTRLAVREFSSMFSVSTLEIRRKGPSFTVDTLRAFRASHPRAKLYLILGADGLVEFQTWREPAEIARLAVLAVAARPGSRRSHARHPGVPASRVVWLGNPTLSVSSSAVRERVRRGLSLEHGVPPAVARYIRRHGLYRKGP